MDLLCVLLFFSRAHEHSIIYYGMCTVIKCIIAIVNGTLQSYRGLCLFSGKSVLFLFVVVIVRPTEHTVEF